jgi:cell filamentation protein
MPTLCLWWKSIAWLAWPKTVHVTGFENDPQSERGTSCPRNRFGTTDYELLSRSERTFGIQRLGELANREALGSFNSSHLRKIHWYVFRDVYQWAGEFRVVGLAKIGGAPFAPPMNIASSLQEALDKLMREDFLRGLGRGAFAQRAAYYLGEINAIHPFREGNGRTQREFIRQLALNAGHVLSWSGFSKEENVTASILSHTRGDNSGLANIIETAIAQVSQHRGED